MNKHIALYIILFLSLALSVSAVTINSVSVTDNDVFYSSYDGNKIMNLVVNVTGANASSSKTVTATTVGLEVNGVNPCPKIDLANTNGDLWTGSCDLGTSAGALSSNTFKSGKVLVVANETYGSSDSNNNLSVAIYNVGVPARIGDCYQFDSSSTNFNQELNFNNLDIKLIIQAKDNPACIPQGYNWYTGWLTVGEVRISGVNFNNNVVNAGKITQLADIVKLRFASAGAYQDHKLTIDTTQLPELATKSVRVNLYHLSFLSYTDGFIVSDNNISAEVITWTLVPGDSSMNNTKTFNLEFTAKPGFKGFAVTDTIIPRVISYSPLPSVVFNTTNITFNALIDGTGTAISKAFFVINGVSNNANCVATSNPEQYNCSLTLTQTDGIYNLSIVAYDFGGASGNIVNNSLSYYVQTSPPTITPITPTNGATYASTAGSMMKLKFTATDGNGISSCSYALTGPVSINTTSVSCVENTSTQLYLSAGNYNLILSSNDTTGMTTNSNISFTVTDTTAPVITSNTSNATSTKAILAVVTDESSKCKYDTVDLAYADMRNTFTDNTLTHNATVTLTKDKVYDYYVRCSDLSNNANKESLHLTLVYGTAPVANVTVVKGDPTDTYDLGSLPAGTKVVGIDKAGIPILNMIITTNKLATDVSLKLTAVSKPEETYSEKVYKYITIEHAALSDNIITDVKIKFSVENKWLTDNNINKNDIVLVRYTGNGWMQLNTTLTRDSEDGTDVLYLADSPGLSLFAISKKVQPVVTLAATSNESVVVSNNTVVNNTSTELLQIEDRNINWFWVIVLSIVVFAIVVLFVLIQKNDKENPPIFPEDRTLWGRIKRVFK